MESKLKKDEDRKKRSAVPGAVDPDSPTKALPVIDEQLFMQECADRINTFLINFPNEAQHVLSAFIPYEHEFVEIYKEFRARNRPDTPRTAPGVTVAALFAALMQTPHGNGWFLRPVLMPDPDNPGDALIVRVEAVRQNDEVDPSS